MGKKLDLAYCNECEDLVEFTSREEDVTEVFHDKIIHYKFNICRCKECNSEVAGSIDYNYDKSDARWAAYVKAKGDTSQPPITQV